MSEEQPKRGGNGFLRRVAILFAFAVIYSKLVLNNPEFIPNPRQSEFLHWFMYGVIAWGIITMLSDRLGRS